MVICVPSHSFSDRPSMATRKLWLRLSTSSRITLSSFTTMGRMFRLWGATGVMQSVSADGTTMGPPVERL